MFDQSTVESAQESQSTLWNFSFNIIVPHKVRMNRIILGSTGEWEVGVITFFPSIFPAKAEGPERGRAKILTKLVTVQ